ncbi:MAG: hypothetical protein C4K47_08410 [Candidatus Thorarchaeota archaeon]|nr:MAG: hypothetical protein C4K47_08410 [Candidatus Thorarchaeota archaeon]
MLTDRTYALRMQKLREFTRSMNADFALLTPSPNFRYLTGIHYEMRERLVALIVTRDGEPSIVAPQFDVSNLSRSGRIKDFLPWSEDEDPYSVVAKAVRSRPKECTILLEDYMPIGVLWALEKALGGLKKTLSMTAHLESMRIVKSTEEVELMKKASKIIGQSVSKAMTQARLGMTELEMRQVVANECIRNSGVPTFTTVQFGENTALPHADSGTRQLRRGDIALFDCGCEVEGYNTDITRVAVAGKPSSEQESVYSIVLKAQQAAIDRMKAGLTCEVADSFARQVIEKAGYGAHFTHRLGHGVGLEVHEPPYLVKGNSMQLRAGMTHSVEPGIYLEGKFGIRIEDLILVDEGGCEALTLSPKDLYQMKV